MDLFAWVMVGQWEKQQIFISGASYQVANVLKIQLQHQSFQWILRTDFGWTGWISLQSKGLSRVFFNTTVQKQQFFGAQPSLRFNSHLYMTTRKTIDLTRQSFAGKVMSLLFNVLSRLVIAFLPMSKCLLISWLQSPSAVILEPKTIKSLTVSTVSPSICHEAMGLDAMI